MIGHRQMDWVVEYRTPPLRAIYREYFDCSEFESEIMEYIQKFKPLWEVRKLCRVKDL